MDLPPVLSRAPVGPLDFEVRELEPRRYVAVASTTDGEYRVEAFGLPVRLWIPGGSVSVHDSIDEAETTAARHARRRSPIRIPDIEWKRGPKRGLHPDGSDVDHKLAALDLPFLGLGHLHAWHGAAHAGLDWRGATGLPRQLPRVRLVGGRYDIYGRPFETFALELKTHDVGPMARRIVRLLVRTAREGHAAYRLYPLVREDLEFLPGSRRQVHAYRWWAGQYDAEFEAEQARTARRSKMQSIHTWMDGDWMGQLIFGSWRLFAPLHKQEGTATKGANRGLPTARQRAEQALSSGSEYAFAVARERAPGSPPRARVGVVELVEYRDGPEASVRSLGFYRGRDYHHAGEKTRGIVLVDVAHTARRGAQMELAL